MGCCNSKNKVRDVVNDQVVVVGENELSNKNGRKQSISDQSTTESSRKDRFIYVKPKDNNRNSEIDESKISKWNGVKSAIESVKELSNKEASDDKRPKPLVEFEKSKDETKPADQNKRQNYLETKETESNEAEKKLEKESKPTIERKNDQDVDFDALYDFSFELESDEEKENKRVVNNESKSDEKVKNNDQSLVRTDPQSSNQSLSIEKQIEEIINELISNASSKTHYKEIKSAESESENSNNNNSNVVIKQQPEIGKEDETNHNHNLDKQIDSIANDESKSEGENDTEKVENNDLEDKTDYDTKYDFSFELESDEEKENKSVVNDDKIKNNDQSLVRIDSQSGEEIKQHQYIQKPGIEGNSNKLYEKANSQEQEEISNSNQTNNNVDKEVKKDDSIKQKQDIGKEDYRLDLERQEEEWKSLIESLTSNSKLMNYALAKSRTEFKLVKDVGYYLSACREAKSNTEKAWLVYVWITHNIEYDVVCLENKDYRFCKPQSVLERGLAICAGYAELYKTLCAQLSVKCVIIGGYSKGAGYKVGQKVTEESHAWNAIPLGSDGKLRFIESTWGARHLDENKTFVKKFEPHYFAVPAHIFNESHHSGSYTPTDGTKKFTLDEFDDCPNNKLDYHILGLSCVNNTMRAITRTNKNPLVIEYTARQKIYFTTKLVDEETEREFKDGILVQSEYSSFKDQKSRYCLIVDIPEKGRNYKLQLFVKNKHSSEYEENSYSMITEFIVVREGDEENSIPRYNLTFDYDLSLTSHFSQYIKFKTNPFIMEFEALYNNNRRIYFLAKLIDEKTGRETKNAAFVQSEYSMSKDEKSKYCMIIEIPEKLTKYKLQLFASCDKKEKTFPFLTDFILIREGDEECSIPRYNLTFDHDLRLTSHFSHYIKFKTNQLVMEFEAPNNNQTPQKIYFEAKLLEERTGIEIKNSAVFQYEYAMFKDQKSRYCVIADIPEKRKKYKLQLLANNKLSSEYNKDKFPFLIEFIVIREGDEESYIPQYNLSFAHDIKLKSHYCQFIKFKTNPLVMEFEVPKHIKTLFNVKTMNDSETEDVFSQINPENSKTVIQIILPRKKEKFILNIYAKHVLDQGDYVFVSQMFLIRTRSNKNDDLRFCKVKMRGADFFIYSPIEYYLSSNNL